ncbi:MAG: hypothetical protein M1826_005068 [Phylliscum demangeonii]|nr:MAG: hypothetical protein M1826_005068 [Phylliscum demangeonii]
MQPVEKKVRTVWKTDSPFTVVQWPSLTAEDQDTILTLLLSLLTPIGQHRRLHLRPSNGRRDQRRKAPEARSQAATTDLGAGIHADEPTTRTPPPPPPPSPPPPPPPSISDHLTIGFNSTTRHLERLAHRSAPRHASIPRRPDPAPYHAPDPSPTTPAPPEPLAAIFVPRSSQPPLLHAHLPLLTYTASLASPGSPATRLVALPAGAEPKLGHALGLAHVSFVGLKEAALPQAASLIACVRRCVPAVDVPWLRALAVGAYLPLRAEPMLVPVPVVRKRKREANAPGTQPATAAKRGKRAPTTVEEVVAIPGTGAGPSSGTKTTAKAEAEARVSAAGTGDEAAATTDDAGA